MFEVLVMRKCEIQLPLNYSDGKRIEQEKLKRIRDEVITAFDSFAEYNQRARRYDGVACIEVATIEIITTDDKRTKKRLKELKERLKEVIPEVDILITTQAIQAI